MGLALSVGFLADLKQNDAEGFETYTACFADVNKLLSANKLPAHTEPTDVEPWGAEMYGYSGLHHLRRLAAYIDSGVESPSPGNDDSSKDERLEAYFADVGGTRPRMLSGLFGKRPKFRREFDHLIVHSDCEGFYLPMDFPHVLFADEGLQVPGAMLGSTPRLLAECDRLARVLAIPPHINKDSEELWNAADSQGEGDTTWQRFGIESFTCVALSEACRMSMKTGSAVVFT